MERVARIFPDCTTTVVVCGYVNRSQSKYICTHRCNAARSARSVDRDAIVCLVPRAVSTFSLPRVHSTKCGNECRRRKLMRFDSEADAHRARGVHSSLARFRFRSFSQTISMIAQGKKRFFPRHWLADFFATHRELTLADKIREKARIQDQGDQDSVYARN